MNVYTSIPERSRSHSRRTPIPRSSTRRRSRNRLRTGLRSRRAAGLRYRRHIPIRDQPRIVDTGCRCRHVNRTWGNDLDKRIAPNPRRDLVTVIIQTLIGMVVLNDLRRFSRIRTVSIRRVTGGIGPLDVVTLDFPSCAVPINRIIHLALKYAQWRAQDECSGGKRRQIWIASQHSPECGRGCSSCCTSRSTVGTSAVPRCQAIRAPRRGRAAA